MHKLLYFHDIIISYFLFMFLNWLAQRTWSVQWQCLSVIMNAGGVKLTNLNLLNHKLFGQSNQCIISNKPEYSSRSMLFIYRSRHKCSVLNAHLIWKVHIITHIKLFIKITYIFCCSLKVLELLSSVHLVMFVRS